MCVDSSALSNLRIFFSWGEATSSGNRDAVSGSRDSFCMELSAACISAGSSSQTSSQVATSFAPCLISVFGPQEFLLVTLPGTAYTSRFCSRAQREVMRVPLYSAASTTSTPTDMPLMIRLRMGKFCGAGKVPTGNSEISAPPKATICSASRDVGRKAFGHAAAVGRGMTCSHHRDAGLGQYLDVPFHKEDHGRIVNFLQPRRVFGIAERNNFGARLGRLDA